MRKILSLVLSLLMVFSLMPMTMVSADTITATHVYTMDEGNRIVSGYTKYHWSPGFVDIGDDHGYVYRSETKADAYAYFRLPAGWSTDYGKVTKISFELGGATSGYFNNPGFMLATGVDSNYKYTGAVRGVWSNVSWTAGSWTKVEIDVSDKDTFIIDGTEARYMCFGQQKSLGVQNSSDKTKGWFYIDNLTLTYEVEADLPEYDITIDGEVVDTVMETKNFTVPTPAEGYHYTDGTTDYFGGEEITVTGPVALTSVINTYDVTVDGAVAGTIAHGGTFTVPTPATGYDYTDGTNTYVGGEEIVVTDAVALTSVVKTTKEVYTMDEGKALEGATTFYGAGSVMDVNGDNKLALKAKADAYAYFKLPENWSSKPYYKPTKITFTASSSDTSKVKAYKSLSFASALTDNYLASGSSYTIATEGNLKYFPTTVSINVTEDMYSYKYITGKLYSDNWSEEAPLYVYIDNVTIDYVYDFDYVAPTTYDVTIDGVKVATVEEGDTFVLPAAPDGKQYVDGYTAGQEFVVTSDLAFTTEDIPAVAPVVAITMQKGAGLRFNEVTGMRYKATVDTAAVEGYIAEGYTVTMGTLISPADIIGSFDALTFEADENNYLDVVTTGYFNEETGTIAGTISNIREANWGRNYIARSYVKLEKDGEVYVSYATENDNTRSVKFLANAVIDNNALPANTAQVALIEKWAAAADWKA